MPRHTHDERITRPRPRPRRLPAEYRRGNDGDQLREVLFQLADETRYFAGHPTHRPMGSG